MHQAEQFQDRHFLETGDLQTQVLAWRQGQTAGLGLDQQAADPKVGNTRLWVGDHGGRQYLTDAPGRQRFAARHGWRGGEW